MTSSSSAISEVAADLASVLGQRMTRNKHLAFATTYRIGGPVDIFVEVESIDELAALGRIVRDRIETFVVGRGSNVLVSDSGFSGVAIRLGRFFRSIEALPNGLCLGGAVLLPVAARMCTRLGFAGFEFACEVPASFGGAVAMNAGAHGTEISDVLESLTTVDVQGGDLRTRSVAEVEFSYRSSSLLPTEVVCEGRIKLDRGDPKQIAARVSELLRLRRENQPAGRSAGSVFKNPDGDSAGRLIEACGLKATTRGGAHISDVHANFIVAEPNATAEDVHSLVVLARNEVRERFGVTLVPEIKFVGEFSDA